MPDHKFHAECFFCEQAFRFGPHVYDGRKLSGYGVMACRGCYSSNHDGWVEQYGGKLAAHFQLLDKIMPPRNSDGYYPREF